MLTAEKPFVTFSNAPSKTSSGPQYTPVPISHYASIH